MPESVRLVLPFSTAAQEVQAIVIPMINYSRGMTLVFANWPCLTTT